jgi:hypothetical protein
LGALLTYALAVILTALIFAAVCLIA